MHCVAPAFLYRASKLPSLPDDEYYHADLIGLDAYDTGGVLMGKVSAVHNHGAGDIRGNIACAS
jgi:ribosomal 30S subunit maturation factor RimM